MLIALLIVILLTSPLNGYFKLRTIILVPGNGGSRLEAKLNKSSVVHYFCDSKTDRYFNLWLNLADLVPFVIDCWVDNMRLVYNNITRTTSPAPGVSIRVPDFGNTTALEFLDPSQVSVTGYYNILIDEMVKIGYTRGVTLKGAPYDFRKAPNELGNYFRKLKKLIKNSYYSNENERVVIICHSLGCPTMLYFLNHLSQKWKDTYIHCLISLAGPWGGAIKALKAFTSGDNLGAVVIPTLTLRKDERTFPSIAFLLPNEHYWKPNEVIIASKIRNYTVYDYYQLFKDIDYMTGYEMWLDTKNIYDSLSPPNVELHCIHGYGIDTMSHLLYKNNFPDTQPKITNGEGDGTVNLRSLKGCLRWKNKQNYPIYYKSYKHVDHMSVMSEPQIIEYIKRVVIINYKKVSKTESLIDSDKYLHQNLKKLPIFF